jgi:hypothetical protein
MKISAQIEIDARNDDGLASVAIRGTDVEGLKLDLPFADLYRAFGTPNPTALDLLVVAAICYAVDKTTARDGTSDEWTRQLEVSFPVSEPERWASVAQGLDVALTFLTGDVWQTSFHQAEADLFVAPKRRRRLANNPQEPETFEAVGLLSGGLDSLIGTIDFLEEHPKSRMMLVGHYDFAGPKSQQDGIYELLRTRFPGRTKLVQVRVSQRPQKNAETSLRSRSIVFLASGMYAAVELGADVPLLAPENGIIAVNMPLTPSRLGSCSTRTMHPFYLTVLRDVFKDLGIQNALVNPLELKTKGECVTQCRNLSLLMSLIPRTVSCSHATRRQNWKRKSAPNCGYCFPCLCRRASVHAAGLDSGKDYGIDVCSNELTVDSSATSADDLRAVTSGLMRFKTDASIRKAIAGVAPAKPLDAYVNLVQRGLTELRTWIAEKGSASLRTAADIPKGGHA